MAELKAGAAIADMTPPAGILMAGGWKPVTSEGVETPLMAHALVLDDGVSRLAVVGLDLIALMAEDANGAKDRIQEATGIPPGNVLIACSHTHEGPYPAPLLGRDTHFDPAFMKMVGEAIVGSVVKAAENTVAAEVAFGSARAPGLCQNRRRLKGPNDAFNAWALPREDVEKYPPAGPVDDEVALLAVRKRSGEPLALLWNFALHAHAFWKRRICADYPYYVGRKLAQALGAEAVSVFMAGACGDINRPSQAQPETIVERLTEGLVGIYRRLDFVGRARLGAVLRPFEAELRDFSSFQEEDIRRKLPSALETARDEWELLRQDGRRRVSTVLHALAVGDFALVGVPGEYFCALGLDIKKRSPFSLTAVAELSNDYVGYIPTDAAFGQGGYELFNMRSSKVARGTGERMADELARMLDELRETVLRPGV